MIEKKYIISLELVGILYKNLGIILLYLLWFLTDGSGVGFFFILFLIIMMLLRWRVGKLKWTLLIDQVACIAISFFWYGGIYGLGLIAFDTMLLKFPIGILPVLLYALYNFNDYFLLIVLAQSFFVGTALLGWKLQTEKAVFQRDEDSRKRYELESMKNDLLVANVQVVRMAEISERARIAREIHDNAGHEIIAAYMSLQVVEGMLDDPKQCKEMFSESMKRLESGIEKIRESVHNLAPLTTVGVEYLQKLCDEFTLCPINIAVHGDTSKVPIYLWSILEPCLKEALTNIVRHSEAQNVSVALDVTPYIVRLSVENDGVKRNIKIPGIGLRNLKQRAVSVGGNISTDMNNGFRLICVLPIE